MVRVLLVTSGPGITRMVRTALADPASSWQEVWSTDRALRLLDEGGPYDVVIADNDTMPAGGFHLAREVKARARMGRDVPPVVLLVSREQDDYLARWAEADAWVLKPIDPFDLAEVVSALVGRQPVPALPGVRTLAEQGSIHGPGQAEALSPAREPGGEPTGAPESR